MRERIIVGGRTVLAVMRCSAMLRKTIYSMPIIILTIGAASAQTDMELRDIKGGQTSFRTQLEKKNDRDIDRAYDSAMKRVPNAEKKKSDPWADSRSAPPVAGKNKQLRIVSSEKKSVAMQMRCWSQLFVRRAPLMGPGVPREAQRLVCVCTNEFAQTLPSALR
jgi:hypothetical protein